jgi:hypothetical protein
MNEGNEKTVRRQRQHMAVAFLIGGIFHHQFFHQSHHFFTVAPLLSLQYKMTVTARKLKTFLPSLPDSPSIYA